MDIFSLFLLYYLTQKPALLESIKPIAGLLKNSEESLKFLEVLKTFSSIFEGLATQNAQSEHAKQQSAQASGREDSSGQSNAQATRQAAQPQNETRHSPFQGIADELLQHYLDEYLGGNTKE